MPTTLRWKSLVAAALAVATACHRPNDFGALPAPGPRGIVVAPVRDYPFGDAVDVYRAALDLLYSDGADRPGLIVMLDSVRLLPGWSCPKCGNGWPGKAVVDTSTFGAFLRQPRVQPRLQHFRYTVPIHYESSAEQLAIAIAGQAYDAAHPQLAGKMPGGFDGEFRRRFPGAWGTASFSLVGFNPAHTEAILQIRQLCGPQCNSDDLVFFKRTGDKWQAMERLTLNVMAEWAHTTFRYSGPSGKNPGDSELLADRSGVPFRTEGQDAPIIYRVVVDSMYSFHGEHPRTIVVSGQHALANFELLPYKDQIDSSTRATFRFLSSIRDRLHPTFDARQPIVEMTTDSIDVLDREGMPLEKEAASRYSIYETAFWLAFRKHYPGAWGYMELSRIGFNPEHTQALVYSAHLCGTDCSSGDVWFLTRAGENWIISERLTQSGQAPWAPDSLLRYIGRGADPKNNRPGRTQGVVSSFETGKLLPGVEISFFDHDYLKTVKTDASGHFVVDDLPARGGIFFGVACPVGGSSETAGGDYLSLHPGLDTTVNVAVPFSSCKHLNRADPLFAGASPAPGPPAQTRPRGNLTGVYAGVLDALYEGDGSIRAPIMLEPFSIRACDFCVEPEAPRLIRNAVMDPSTEEGFAKARLDTTVTSFPYRRSIEVMPSWDLYSLGTANRREWSAMKDAYPGVGSVISFGKVGFNARGNEALVEFYADSAGSSPATEVALLKKSGTDWRVALRHVEREKTSGEWIGGRCEAGDVPANQPTRAQIEKLAGEFNIVRVGASRAFRGRVDTVRIRIDPLKPSPSHPDELGASATVLDTTGEPNEKVAAAFKYAENAATITFGMHLPPGHIQLDGWYEEYRIFGIGPRGFVGTWLTENGPTVPWRGYFCALARRSKR